MKNINVQKLIEACDMVAVKCCIICGKAHGSSWLFNKLMRYFESEPASRSVTIPVGFSYYIHDPEFCDGEAIIGRDGSLKLYRTDNINNCIKI